MINLNICYVLLILVLLVNGCIPGKQHADPKSQTTSRGEVEVRAFDFEIIKLFKKRPPWLMPFVCI